VEATWLLSPAGREQPEPPHRPELPEQSRQLDLRAELGRHGQPPPL
jgi:hypothetical protein